MSAKLKLPIGIENFKEMRTEGYYYIDKTGLIKDSFGKSRKGKPVYTSKTFRQNAEYEYVEILFRKRK